MRLLKGREAAALACAWTWQCRTIALRVAHTAAKIGEDRPGLSCTCLPGPRGLADLPGPADHAGRFGRWYGPEQAACPSLLVVSCADRLAWLP